MGIDKSVCKIEVEELYRYGAVGVGAQKKRGY